MTVRGYAVQFAPVQDISHLVNVCDTMMPHTDTSYILVYREHVVVCMLCVFHYLKTPGSFRPKPQPYSMTFEHLPSVNPI